MDLHGKGSREELGGAEGEKTVFRLYHMKKESVFNKIGREMNCLNVINLIIIISAVGDSL